jgi:hypothetical protein
MPETTIDIPAFDLCLYPFECCVPGPHETFECHTAEMAEELAREAEGTVN